MKNNVKVILMGFGLSLFASMASASSVTIPNNFTAGTAAVAAEVNGNFSAVKSAVDDNDSRLSNLEAGAVSVSLGSLIDSSDGSTCELARTTIASAYYKIGSGNSCHAVMSVSLPHGRQVTGLKCQVYDNDGGVTNVDYISLIRTLTQTGSAVTMYRTGASVNSAGTQQLSDVTTTANRTIDNNNNRYSLVAFFDTSSSGSALDIRVHGCQITYQ
jgi:hypothetical protein